jgi:hypothetical protein
MGGDSGMMSFGRTVIGVGLGADGVGMTRPPEVGDLPASPLCMNSDGLGTCIGGAGRLLAVPPTPFACRGSDLELSTRSLTFEPTVLVVDEGLRPFVDVAADVSLWLSPGKESGGAVSAAWAELCSVAALVATPPWDGR